MKICMVLYDMQEFGGLEEYATTLAIGLGQQGHQVSVLSTAWVTPNNQYLRRLQEHKVPFLQLPRWLSLPASDWETKERILAAIIWLLTPLICLLAGVLSLVKKRSWKKSLESARGWVRLWLTYGIVGRDWRKPFVRLLLQWRQLRWRPDVFHLQGYTQNLLFVIDWASSKGLPVVYEEHQTPDAQFGWWEDFARSVNKATTVIAVSEKSAQALRTVCGITQPIVVRSPLLPDPLASGWQRDDKMRADDDTIRLTTVARLYVTKGLEYLLEAFASVKKSFPRAQLGVYGDGPLRAELLDCAAQLGLDGEAIFVGAFTSRQELSRIMAQTDIFVMSSVLEGQPLGVVEAMAYGCPIVCTNVGGIPEIIQDGINGMLCASKDPECLAQKIRILIQDPALATKLGQAARASYEHGPYQPQAVCEHFDSIYREAIQRNYSIPTIAPLSNPS